MSILEAVTGKDTSFISIMEDSTIDMGSYFGKDKKSEYKSNLESITEEPYKPSKPPKSSSKKIS